MSRASARLRCCLGLSIVLAWTAGCAGPSGRPPAGDGAESSSTSPVRESAPAEGEALAAAFLSNPEYELLSLSPDGTRVAAVSSHGSVDRIVVFELGRGGAEPVEVLRERRSERGLGASRAIVMLGWASNEHLVYAIETALRDPEDGIDRGNAREVTSMARRMRGIGSRARKTRLYSTDLDGRSRYLGKRWQDGPASQFQHEVIDLLPDDPDHILLNFEGMAVRVNVRNGGRYTLEKDDSLGASWSSDHASTIRAGVSSRGWERDFALHARRSDRDAWETLSQYDPYAEAGFWFAGFSQEPSKLYVYSDLETDRTALHEYDLDRRALGPRIAADATRGSDVVALIQSAHDDSLLAIEHCDAVCRWTYLDPLFEQKWAKVEATFPERGVRVLDRSRSETRWLVEVSSDHTAPVVAWTDLETGEVETLFVSRPGVAGRELSPMRILESSAGDHLPIVGYLTRPPGAEGPGPLVVMPHGGPADRDDWGFDPLVQYLVARGFSVFQPNYRGSTGFGREFEMSGHGEWGGAILGDVLAATRMLVENGVADPARIGIYGHGFGGYLALQALVEAPDLFAAGASFGAVTNLPLMLADNRRFLGQEAIDEKLVLPASGDESGLAASSPVNGAARIRTPVLIGHGSENPRFHEKHADAMIAALRKAGRPVESLRYVGDTGVFLDDRHRIDFYSRLGDFLVRHLLDEDVANLEDPSDSNVPRRLP